MGDPGNPTTPDGGSEPDPEQPGWASPNPPPPPPPAQPAPPPPVEPEPAPPAAPPAPVAPAWGAPTQPPPAWGTPPPTWGAPPVPPVPPTVPGAPGPPGAPGAGWAPQGPPAKKRRLTWLWVLIPVLLVFFASVVVIIVFAVKLVTGPIQATNDYYADISAGRYADAYADLCAPAQRQFTEAEFVERQRSDTASIGRVRSYDFHDSDISNDDDDEDFNFDAVTRGTVERGGSEYDARVSLRREDGDWKVCSVFEG